MTAADTRSGNRRAEAVPGRGGLPRLPGGGKRLDLATLLGLGAALLMILAALVLGGSPGAFLDLPSMLIVLGGSLAVTMASFSLRDMRAAGRCLARATVAPSEEVREVAHGVLALADFARKNGPLALQPLVGPARSQPVLARAIELIVDGLPAEDAEAILRTEIDANLARARAGAAVLRRAAEVAPAMGLIGTLVGLVQMLGHLDDPGKIGPAMAVALLTTFYGAVLGSMVLSPLAAKVERNAENEALVDGLYMLAAGSVARQENPRRLEILINTVLPPELRVSAYE